MNFLQNTLQRAPKPQLNFHLGRQRPGLEAVSDRPRFPSLARPDPHYCRVERRSGAPHAGFMSAGTKYTLIHI